MRKHRIEITIDGEPVRLLCDRLSVGSLSEVSSLRGSRGSSPHPDLDGLTTRRAYWIDQHVEAEPECLVDEDSRSITKDLGTLYISRPGVVNDLYMALLEAQQPTDIDRKNLRIAIRFSHWLDRAIASGMKNPWVETGTSCAKCHELNYCATRGCDGTKQKKVVWYDKPTALRVCPILSFTFEVENTIRLFHWSHELELEGSVLRYRQVHLVAPGNLDAQDSWLIGAFGYLRSVLTEVIDKKGKSRA